MEERRQEKRVGVGMREGTVEWIGEERRGKSGEESRREERRGEGSRKNGVRR